MIQKIDLENFKCHKNFKEELNQITILTGANATGKSSVIQAILLAANSYKNIEKKKVRTTDIYDVNLGLPINIMSENFNDEELKISLQLQNESEDVILALDEKDDTAFQICNYEQMLEDMEKTNFLWTKNLYYLNAERIGPRITYGIKNTLDDYVGSKGEYTSYIINEIDKNQRLDSDMILPDLLKISSITRFSANCEEWLKLLFPNTALQSSVDMEKNISIIKFRNEGEFYLPTGTGFGISCTLPIIVQALIASMKKDSILLIENPEAHLHPFSQSQMGKFLAYIAVSGVQVIVETHSEHIIDGCRLQLAHLKQCRLMKTIFFDKNGKESSHKNIITKENGELEDWPEGFFDQKRLDLRELLEMRRCKA